MPLDETTEAELLAYAYGELPAPAARAFERRLQGDAELQAELAGIMATRELFGRDARWGMDTKVDLPPPHLVDAIVRAEALARPAAIRDARALTPRPTLTARLSRWLIGGGVLVGATAALLLVVKQGDRSAEPAALPLEAVSATGAVEEAPSPPPTDAPATAAPESDERAKDQLAKELGGAFFDDNEGREDRLRATAKRAPLPDAFDPAIRADAKPKPKFKPTEADGDRNETRDLATADRGGAGLGLLAPGGGDGSAASTRAGGLAGEAKGAGASGPDIVGALPEKPKAASVAADDELFALDSVSARAASLSPAKLTAPPPPPPAAATPAPTSTAPRSNVAPSAPPSEAPGLAQRPSTGVLEVLSPAEAKAERRRLADERAKRKKPAAKTEKLAEQEHAGSKADAKKSADKAPPAQPGPEQKRAMQSEMALMSGYRELKEGRALSALGEFESAERFDARRALGSDPHVGQMRSLIALKRPAEALMIARRLVTRDLKEVGVADGLLLGAKLAEQLGDLRSARELWSVLLKSPAHTNEAQQALARVLNPPVRAQLEAADAAEAAPAAEPASKE